MRMTLNVDDELVAKASELTGVHERTSLVRMGLEALIAQKSAQRLAKLGGTESNFAARAGVEWHPAATQLGSSRMG